MLSSKQAWAKISFLRKSREPFFRRMFMQLQRYPYPCGADFGKDVKILLQLDTPLSIGQHGVDFVSKMVGVFVG